MVFHRGKFLSCTLKIGQFSSDKRDLKQQIIFKPALDSICELAHRYCRKSTFHNFASLAATATPLCLYSDGGRQNIIWHQLQDAQFLHRYARKILLAATPPTSRFEFPLLNCLPCNLRSSADGQNYSKGHIFRLCSSLQLTLSCSFTPPAKIITANRAGRIISLLPLRASSSALHLQKIQAQAHSYPINKLACMQIHTCAQPLDPLQLL